MCIRDRLTSQSGITTTIDYQMSDLTVDTITVQSGGLKMPVGMSTFQNVTVTGDLTVNGTSIFNGPATFNDTLTINEDGSGSMGADQLGEAPISGITFDGNSVAFETSIDAQGQSLTLQFNGSIVGV